MELRGGAAGSFSHQQQLSPDSVTQESGEVCQEQQRLHRHRPPLHIHHHQMGPMMEESPNAHHHLTTDGAAHEQDNPYPGGPGAAHFFQQTGMIKQEAFPSPFFSMEQLCWPSTDQAELMESMSPESADLCRNLSSQLENFRKELVSFHGSESSSGEVLQQQQLQGTSSSNGLIPASMAPDLMIAGSTTSPSESEMLKAAIMSHPHYPELVVAHMNCHKIGASPEVISQIDEIIQNFKDFQPPVTTSLGTNPELDQFMVSYYNMLLKYEKEIRKTFKEAVAFCKKLEQQLRVITNASVSSVASVESDDRNEGYDTSEDEDSAGEVEIEVDPMAKDKELKEQLMRKYSGYISSLKHEFLKKKKKGKLPKDSRQQLLNWWTAHYNWPYPSESQKASLAESTGLDQKQINNWFINQRKRHWKPSDEITALAGQASQANAEASSGS